MASIELEKEEGGNIRVRVDSPGERAISYVMDPMKLIADICETAEISCLLSEGQMTILYPEGYEPPAEAPEEEEPESA